MRGLIKICALALAAIALLPVALRASDEARQAKAKYVFTEAIKQLSNEKVSESLALLNYAQSLDPDNTAIGQYKAKAVLQSVFKPDGGMTETDLSEMVDLMEKHFNAHPEDIYENRVFGRLCQQMGKDSVAIEVWKRTLEIDPSKQSVRYLLASSLVQLRRYNDALAVYDSIERYDGIGPDIVWAKAGCHHLLNDTVGAVKEVRRLYDPAPNVAQYNMMLAELYNNFNLPDSAFKYLIRTRDIDPENGPVHIALAQFYNQRGNYGEYQKEIFSIAENENIDIDEKCMALEDYEKKWFRRLADKYAERNFDADSNKQALKEFNKLSMKEQLNDLGMSTDSVCQIFDFAISEYPQEPRLHEMYADLLQATQDYAASNEHFQAVVDAGDGDDEIERKMLINHIQLEQIAEADTMIMRAVKKDPAKITYFTLVAAHYYKTKDHANIIKTYERAISLCDSTDIDNLSSFNQGIGDQLLSEGDTTRAITYYEKCIEINPKNVMALNNYAYLLCQLGIDLDKAERYAGIAVQQSPNSSTFLDTYAWVYFAKREYSLALIYIERALSQDKDEASWEEYDHYGDILFMNGRHSEAVEQWKIAVEKAVEDEVEPDALLIKKVENETYFPPQHKTKK